METWIVDALKSGSGLGAFAVAAYFIWKIVVAVQARRQNGATNAAHSHPPGPTTATGLPVLGGSNPAAGETSAVVADPAKAPLTHGEHENLCGARQAVTNAELKIIKTTLADTNSRMSKIETGLKENTEAHHKAVGKLNEAVAVIKDRTNRGG